jgi:hypothetical protein
MTQLGRPAGKPAATTPARSVSDGCLQVEQKVFGGGAAGVLAG